MPVAKERDFESKCQAKRCKADATITVFTVGLCDSHWTEAAEEGLLKDWCAKHLNRPAAIEVRKAVAESERSELPRPTIPELFLPDLPEDPKIPSDGDDPPVDSREVNVSSLWQTAPGETTPGPAPNERLEEMRQRER